MSAGGDSFLDQMVLYCSYFSYAPDAAAKRQKVILTPVNEIMGRIQRLETQQVIKNGTAAAIAEFLEADEGTQRKLFDVSTVSNETLWSL